MWINDEDDQGNSIVSFIQTLDSITSTPKGFVRISKKFDTSQYLLFQVTDVSSINQPAGYYDITITNQASGGSNFSDSADIIVSFITSGNKGEQGNKGEKGYRRFNGK